MSDYARPGLPKSDPSLLRLQLVGPMQAFTLDNQSVLPPGRKTRGLLAILAMSGRRPVLRSKLAEMLWSRRSEEQARASLRQEIHRLLDALSPVGASVVSVERHSLALRPGLTTVDAERLLNANVNHVLALASAQANAQAGPGGGGQAFPPLDGVLLEELNGTDPALDLWLKSERRRLHEHALGLFEAALQRGPDGVAAIAVSRQLLLLDPLHEAAWRGLIRAQLQLGERGAALQSADRCAALFSRRVSGQPGPETGRLLAELRNDIVSLGAPAFPDAPERDNAHGPASHATPDPQPDVAASQFPGPPAAIAEDAVIALARHRQQGRSIATLAVLPLLDLDAGADDTLVPSLTDELIAGLAMDPLLSVISGSSLAQALAQGRDDALLRRNFGLDYVLDGTVLRGRTRIRIIVRLLDLRLHGHVVWAQRFDCDLADAPADTMVRLDDVASLVSAQLPWELLVIESRRMGSRPPAELNALQLTLRALYLTMRPERLQNDKARELLARAEAMDPDQPLIAMVDGLRQAIRVMQFWSSPGAEGRAAEATMHKALKAGSIPTPLIAVSGFIRGQLLGEPLAGLALIERSLEINPNMTMGHVFAAIVLVQMGRLDDAERHFRRYKQLSPLHPAHYLFDGIAVTIALLKGDAEEAARIGRALVELTPALLDPAIPCLAAFGELGLHDEAERLLTRIQGVAPGLSIDRVLAHMQWQRAVDRERLTNGLRAAGMPQMDADTNASAGPAAWPRRRRGESGGSA